MLRGAVFCGHSVDLSDLLYGSKLPNEKSAVNRHFQSSLASQHMGCLLEVGVYITSLNRQWFRGTVVFFFSLYSL